MKEITPVIKNLSQHTEKTSDFQKIEKNKTLPNSFHEARINLRTVRTRKINNWVNL